TVYPNPATETMQLQFSDGSRPTAAYVLNALGEKVATLQAATHAVDVSSLASGIYLLYAESAAGIYKARVCVY
ncbi:MAG: T9SS type A sorting domain-containing protein, partial [Bacteroidetes bacterium]|nr:T9SS type A sorting domain-containing protein [Bacteroidota bacterium]